MDFLYFVLFGLIVGAIARFLVPGRDPAGFIVTALLGMVGSLVGGFLWHSFGYGYGPRSAGWIASIVGAMLVLLVYRMVAGRRVAD